MKTYNDGLEDAAAALESIYKSWEDLQKIQMTIKDPGPETRAHMGGRTIRMNHLKEYIAMIRGLKQ